MTDTKTLTKDDLIQFTGSEHWYRYAMVRDILYTDGVKYVTETAGAYRDSRPASTSQDDACATCSEDLFTECVSCRARGRRSAYLIVWSEAAAGHTTADNHGFDLANNGGIAAAGS
jgi:hypothetical protein